MNSRINEREQLLAAVRRASENSVYLVGFPTDKSAITELLQAATTICRIARALGNKRMADLGKYVARCAQGDLSPIEVIANVNKAVSRIADIAGALTHESFMIAQTVPPESESRILDPLCSLTDTRWVTL